MDFAVVPFDAPLGAEILGLDLRRVSEGPVLSRIRQALLDHLVIVFRDDRIAPAEHVAFSRLLGPLQIHVLRQFQLPGHPEVLVDADAVAARERDLHVFFSSSQGGRARPSVVGELLRLRRARLVMTDELIAATAQPSRTN